MATAPAVAGEKSSSSDSDSDTENDSSEASETTESVSSFDQFEEEDDLSSEGIVEEPTSRQLQFEINEETPPGAEATVENSCQLGESGLTECGEILKKLSRYLWAHLSKSELEEELPTQSNCGFSLRLLLCPQSPPVLYFIQEGQLAERLR